MLKNLLLYLVSLLLIGYFALMYNEYYTGVLFVVWIIFLLCLFLILIITYVNLSISVEVDNRVVKKEDEFHLIITVVNKSIFPISRVDIYLETFHMFGKEVKKEKIKIAMDKKNTQKVVTSVYSNYSGVIRLKVRKVKLYDLLHITSLSRGWNKQVEVVSLPEYNPIGLPMLENPYYVCDDGEVIDKIGDDPSQVFGIRDYVPGDRPSRIHHKLSYKYDTIMVKDFSDVKSVKKLVLFDYNIEQVKSQSYGFMDTIFQVFFSCVMDELKENYEVWISYYSKEGTFIKAHVESEEVFYEYMEDILIAYSQLSYGKFEKQKGKSILEYHLGDINQYSHINYISSFIYQDILPIWWEEQQDSMLHFIYINHLNVKPLDRAYLMEILSSTENKNQEERIHIFEINING